MRILILGGTQFVGRHLAALALAAGHAVTLFHRGRTNPGLFPEAEHVLGDRNQDLDRLAGGNWDAAIDTSAYLPGQVDALWSVLAGRVGHYTFVSTVSVYADPVRRGADEAAPLAVLPRDRPTDRLEPDTYGPLKVLCEQRAEAGMPGRTLVVRPGVIAGAWDPTDRLAYWLLRPLDTDHPAVVVPDWQQQPLQLIDARDLTAWLLDMAVRSGTGVYNAAGADSTLGAVIEACFVATSSTARRVPLPPEALVAAGVVPWQDIPLWLPAGDAGAMQVSSQRAVTAGLVRRPVDETIADCLAWRLPLARPLAAGWTRQREAALLASL